ncbi:peptidase domain-containing ABC transporter [Budvicia diplopodorum]|uniref:peptidase domain-containing ABC transporter n=1 Tax=Budvicia diplopodorum TaxID=1119056 RepID=UPI00135AF53E|nr:peptidase domain-containing ABC transporter [Budvicia diplopodorum]
MQLPYLGSIKTVTQVPVILQHEYTECGLACIAMVMGAYGRHTSLAELRRLYTVSLEGGTSIADLAEFASKNGMSNRLLFGNVEQLEQLSFPVIAFWRNVHFVVIVKANKSGIVVHDPELGVRRYTYAEAKEHFSNYVLELRPEEGFQKSSLKQGSGLSLDHLIHKVTDHGKNQLLLLALAIFGMLLMLAVPSYVQLVVDQAIQKNDFDLVILLTGIFFLVFSFQVISGLFKGLLEVIARNFSYDELTRSAWRHKLNLGLGYFQRRSVSSVLAIDKSLEACAEFISNGNLKMLVSGAMAIISMIAMFIYNPIMAICTCGLMTLFFIVRFALIGPYQRAVDREISEVSRYQSMLVETHSGMPYIKSNALENDRHQVLDIGMRAYINASMQKDLLMAKFDAVSKMIVDAEQLLVVCLGAWMVIQGELSVGMLYAYLSYKQYFSDSTVDFSQQLLHRSALKAPLGRISDLMMTEEERESFGHLKCPEYVNEICIDNLRFAYPDKQPVINGVHLVWQRDEEVVLVGHSGAGKTTLLRLLNGMSRANSGDIRFNNVSLNNIEPSSLREHIRIIHADEMLFTGTVLQNVSGFRVQADLQRVKQVCRIAEVDGVIEALVHGYDTNLMPGDSFLSAGEKQRLILARALYQQPDFLLCDELTANMDASTALRVLANLRELDLGLMFITHTPQLIYRSGRMVLLDKGTLSQIEDPIAYCNQQSE